MSLATGISQEQFPSFETFEPDFRFYLKNRLGPGFYPARFGNLTEGQMKVRVGASVPEVIDDTKTGERVVRFRNFDSVFVADVQRHGPRTLVTLPARDTIFGDLSNLLRTSVKQSEGTLLEHVHERLVRIPLVGLALSPIQEIIREVHDSGEVRIQDISSGRGREKAGRYLTFLAGLEMITEKGFNVYVPGPSYVRHQKRVRSDKTLYNAILSEVLRRGYDYLAWYLKLSQIVPFIRVSNSYFLPARAHKHLIYMDKDSFKRKYLDYYGRPSTLRRMFKHVDEVRKVRVFDPREKEFIVADRGIFERYLRTPQVTA